MPDPIKPTRRLPSESTPAYEAFCVYAELGPDRTLRETAEKLSKSCCLVSRWAKAHNWKERVFHYDEHLRSVALRAEEQRVARDAGRWAERMQAMREKLFLNASQLVEKAEAMLKFPLAETITADGRTMIKPCRWSMADAARMLEVAARLNQLACGQPTERVEHSGPGGSPLLSLALRVDIASIQARVTEAVEAQAKVDALIEAGFLPVPDPNADPAPMPPEDAKPTD